MILSKSICYPKIRNSRSEARKAWISAWSNNRGFFARPLEMVYFISKCVYLNSEYTYYEAANGVNSLWAIFFLSLFLFSQSKLLIPLGTRISKLFCLHSQIIRLVSNQLSEVSMPLTFSVLKSWLLHCLKSICSMEHGLFFSSIFIQIRYIHKLTLGKSNWVICPSKRFRSSGNSSIFKLQ